MSEDAQLVIAIGIAILLICFGCAHCEKTSAEIHATQQSEAAK